MRAAMSMTRAAFGPEIGPGPAANMPPSRHLQKSNHKNMVYLKVLRHYFHGQYPDLFHLDVVVAVVVVEHLVDILHIFTLSAYFSTF